MRSSGKFLSLLLATIIEFFENNCFNVSSISSKCMCLLIILLTFGPRGLNSPQNITVVVVMERFFFFLVTERDTFSILSNVDFTVFGLFPLTTK